MIWQAYESGEAIGKTGSEGGVILKDEEATDYVRITLERARYFAITVGLYGVMVHTAFAANLEEATQKYNAMKDALEAAPEDNDDLDAWCDEFTDRFR
ncbi:hypothetical protein [Schleiferilactobacillus harbinensis]|uniref:hypothetical protein n=1 Tax=Schleiferilactobacillus harbinensis TaxID=304207 RepID=UPI0007B7A5B9|nr:hypothetical protein [Schleiferilactobacillus harbinensis]GEK07743.1 hypothetical protein LHA01_29820 [Schleiferilactobacillus harbinensis]